jgi:hypothetical protein
MGLSRIRRGRRPWPKPAAVDFLWRFCEFFVKILWRLKKSLDFLVRVWYNYGVIRLWELCRFCGFLCFLLDFLLWMCYNFSPPFGFRICRFCEVSGKMLEKFPWVWYPLLFSTFGGAKVRAFSALIFYCITPWTLLSNEFFVFITKSPFDFLEKLCLIFPGFLARKIPIFYSWLQYLKY